MNTETKTKIDELIARLGVSMNHTPPTLASIERKSDGKVSFWHCLRFMIAIRRDRETKYGMDHFPVWEGPYKMGLGNFPQIQHQAGKTDNSKPLPQWKRDEIEYLLEFGEFKGGPSLPDVLYSLLSDGAAFFDAASFEEWAGDYGYDEDSRTAERMFQECRETGRKLARAFTQAEIEELREAFQDY